MQYAFMIALVGCLLLGVFFYQDFAGASSTGGMEPTGWMSSLAESISASMNSMSNSLGF